MANIELHRSFTGGGLSGRVELPPTLSWAEHDALLQTAANSGLMVEGLAYTANAVARLEASLGYRLGAQLDVLGQQLEQLDGIAAALRTPAKTRAAERLVDAGRLLETQRYDRALEAAKQAIDDDPTNPATFSAAGWACLGLAQLVEARTYFREEAEAGHVGDVASAARRKAARTTLALETPLAALAELGAEEPGASPAELAGHLYDRAVYLALADRRDEAEQALRAAGERDAWQLARAAADPLLTDMPLAALAQQAFEDMRACVERDCDEQLTLWRQALVALAKVAAEREAGGPFAQHPEVEAAWPTAARELTELGVPGELERRVDEQRRRMQPAETGRAAREAREACERWTMAAETILPLRADARLLAQHRQLAREVLAFAATHRAATEITPGGDWQIRERRRFGPSRSWIAFLDARGSVVIMHPGEGSPPRMAIGSERARLLVQGHVEMAAIVQDLAARHHATAQLERDGVWRLSENTKLGPGKRWRVVTDASGQALLQLD
jgi:hypothetical protein